MSPESSNPPLAGLPDRTPSDHLRLLAIGNPDVVNDCVMSLFRLGYARPEEWSRLLPGAVPGEVMRILTKRLVSSEQD